MAFSQSGAPDLYAIQNATIHPGTGPEIANGTIVVRKGLIEAIGADAPVPAGAWTIDGKGLHVYPGLIDALSRWGLPAVSEAPAARSAAVPTGGGRRGGGDETSANVQFQDDGGPEERPSNTSWVKAADLASSNIAPITSSGDCSKLAQTRLCSGRGRAGPVDCRPDSGRISSGVRTNGSMV